MKQRSIGMAILLSFLTCGIYSIYWFVVLTDDINEAADPPEKTSGGMSLLLLFVTFGIYGIYWYYKMGKLLDGVCLKRGMGEKNNAITCLLLGIFGLGIISYAIMQNVLNELPEAKYESSAAETFSEIKKAVIVGSAGIYKGQSFDIEDGVEVVFGRDVTCCNIIFPQTEKTVSRKHCSVKYIGVSDTFFVTAFSKNGVVFDGNQRITEGSSKMLKKGSVISLGTDDNQFILG